MTFAERTRSALGGKVVLIRGPLPLMKVLWTDNVSSSEAGAVDGERDVHGAVGMMEWVHLWQIERGKHCSQWWLRGDVGGGVGRLSLALRLMRACLEKDRSLELKFITFFLCFHPEGNATSDSCMSHSPFITSYYCCQGVRCIQINAATHNWCSWLSYCQTCYHTLWWAIGL